MTTTGDSDKSVYLLDQSSLCVERIFIEPSFNYADALSLWGAQDIILGLAYFV